MQVQSLSLQEAAGNLLEKAYAALRHGDEERWHGYARKAAALPWDEHEDVHPATMEVHMVLYSEMSDAVENGADDAWLTAAGESLDVLDDAAADALRAALSSIEREYRLPQHEVRRVHDLIAGRAADDDDMRFGLTAASSVDDVVAVIEPMMRALVAYNTAMHHPA